MSIRFDLSAASPTLAANKLEAKSCGAVTTTEGAVLSRRARSPASDPQPNRPTLDPFYSDGREDPEGFLGTRSPTWIETVATRIYRTLNGGHLTWSYHSRWVVLFTDVGRACRVASFFMAVVICIVGYWILDPPIVGRFAISRNDELGDGLAFTTWMLWIVNAAVFMLARLVARDEGFPWYADPTLPALLWNDAKPLEEDPASEGEYLIVLVWQAAGAFAAVISSHSLITQTYVAREWLFAALLVLMALYELLAALNDVLRSGSPYGIPRGWARYLMVLRSLVLIPMQTIFTAWMVGQSFPSN